jgi:hypothetical protein
MSVTPYDLSMVSTRRSSKDGFITRLGRLLPPMTP